METGVVIDPIKYGSPLYSLNSAHGTACDTVCLTIGSQACLRATKKIKSSQQLFWDYHAVTDNKSGHLLKMDCTCGGKECEVTFSTADQGSYFLDACNGKIIVYKA